MKPLRIISYLLVLLILILGISFAVRNDATVTLDYFLGKTTTVLSLLMVYSLGIGIILGFLAIIFPLFKLRRENRSLRHRIKQLEKTVVSNPH